MVIAAYAGTGKSTLAKQYDKAVEVVSMPYAWILPPERDGSEHEAEKAASYHIRNPLYPMNMLLEVLNAEREHGCVIIPTVSSLIKVLQERYDRMVVICYPENGLQEEYRNRYILRGNTDEFIELFVDRMDTFLKTMKENTTAHHLVLKSGEYLSDHIDELERLMAEDKSESVCQEWITALQQHLDDKKKGNALVMLPLRRRTNYGVILSDLDDADVRNWVYQMGRKLGSELSGFLIVINQELLAQLKQSDDVTIVDRETFEHELDGWLQWNFGYFAVEDKN